METWVIALIFIVVFLVLIIIVGIVVYFEVLQPECNSNDDCTAPNVCSSGKCVPMTGECQVTEDCLQGQVCQNNRCVNQDGTCDSSTHCRLGSMCHAGTMECQAIFQDGDQIRFKSVNGTFVRECGSYLYAGGETRSVGVIFNVKAEVQSNGDVLYRFFTDDGRQLSQDSRGAILSNTLIGSAFEVDYNDSEGSIRLTPYGNQTYFYQAGDIRPGECGQPILTWNEAPVPSNAATIMFKDRDYKSDAWAVRYSDVGQGVINSPEWISSIQLTNIDVQVFSQKNGAGQTTVFTTNQPNLANVNGWNDSIRSIQLVPRGQNRPNPYSFQLKYEDVV